MLRTQTMPLYPNKAQAFVLARWLWLSRRLYNKAIAKRKRHYAKTGKSLTFYDQTAWLTRLRHRCPSFAAMPLEFQKHSLRVLDRSFKAFFQRLKAGKKPGFPRFKGRDRWRSMSCLACREFIAGSKIFVPKLGRIRARNVRYELGKMKCLRIVKRASRWVAQIVIEDGKSPPKPLPVESGIGVDVGLNSFATLSNGDAIANPRFGQLLATKLRKANKALARAKRGSRRRQQTKRRLTIVHERIADARKNFVHQISRRLVNGFDLIAAEKLNVKGMTRSRLAKSILDAAWSRLRFCLAYKAERAGKRYIEKLTPEERAKSVLIVGRSFKRPWPNVAINATAEPITTATITQRETFSQEL